MALNLQGLRTVGYKVGDINKAKEWYSKILGVAPYFDEPFYVGFNVAGYELGLQPEENADVAKTVNVVVYWGVGDVNTAWEELLASDATPFEKPTDVGDGIVVAAVKDPGAILSALFITRTLYCRERIKGMQIMKVGGVLQEALFKLYHFMMV